VTRLSGLHARLHELRGHVLEQDVQVDLLLVVRAEREGLLLADDGHHRLVVELGVVEPVQQMDGARARGRHADPDLAGELGVGAGAERGDLLVPGLDELDLSAVLVEAAEDPVDAVAGIAVHPADTVLVQTLQDVRSDGFRHGHGSFRGTFMAYPCAAATSARGRRAVSRLTARRGRA
jgi:hypothetical protein